MEFEHKNSKSLELVELTWVHIDPAIVKHLLSPNAKQLKCLI